MVRVTIDGRDALVDEGTTILDAARGLGIRVPTLCHVEPFPPSASCSVCAVEIEGRATLVPSCAMPAADGMVVRTNTGETRASTKMALEFLLSDHVGDCIGPCRTGCPARLDIPGFISEISAGNFRRSAEMVFDDLVLPASLGRICPRFCEERCRRADSETPLTIGALHRFVADHDLSTDAAYVPRKNAPTGKTVAIVGAGPAGLAAAYYLLDDLQVWRRMRDRLLMLESAADEEAFQRDFAVEIGQLQARIEQLPPNVVALVNQRLNLPAALAPASEASGSIVEGGEASVEGSVLPAPAIVKGGSGSEPQRVEGPALSEPQRVEGAVRSVHETRDDE